MPRSANKRPRTIVLLLAAGMATLTALLLAELALRLFVSPPRPLGELSYQTEDGTPITGEEGLALGRIVPVPPPLPMGRGRGMFAPSQRFYLCYSDHEQLQRPWFDEQGRVAVRINARGIRDDEDLVEPKPDGQRRIVCIGDSFTFGWGVPEEDGWVHRLESALREDPGGDIRTVNCGAAGTVCIDEYWWGLKHRFHAFEPDMVVLTICLNDLIGSNGLSVFGPSPATGIRLFDLIGGALGRSALDLDPDIDWVDELLAQPKQLPNGTANPLFGPDKPFEAMWSQGVPQRSLVEAKAWCNARKVPFVVVLWPFLQGLGSGRHYPFGKLHEMVAKHCADQAIPFLDVKSTLASTPHEDLWVTPRDMHANPLAQQLATPSIVAFVRDHLND